MPLYRPVCDLLGCTYPVVLAGMGGVSRSDLVVAVTEAGGFGFLGMVRESPAFIRSEVQRVRERTDRRFGVNLIPAATGAALLEEQIATCIDIGVPVVGLFWDLSAALVQRLRKAGIVVVCQVGSVLEAMAAQEAGANVVIAQGCEAGGHVRGETPLYSLLPDVVASVHIPVLAAGGIVSGADVATVLAFGAQGAVIGTAMIVTQESFAHAYHKERLVAAHEGDTVLTEAFHINWPAGAKVRVLANSVTQGKHDHPYTSSKIVIGDEEGRPIYLFSTDSPLCSMTGEFEAMALYAGAGVGRISKITAATERLGEIVSEAMALTDVSVELPDESPAFASPACSAHEMDDVYMGFAGREELLTSLNELLEAERAGARVALMTVREIEDPALKILVTGIHRDEARWCGVLTGAILSLKGMPSAQTGTFYEKAMVIADLSQRLAFLNKGQAWVVRKLSALLPKIRSERIHADITAMLASHEKNIECVASHFHLLGDQTPA